MAINIGDCYSKVGNHDLIGGVIHLHKKTTNIMIIIMDQMKL